LSFEKWALALFAAFVMAMMTWIAVTVNQNQIQYAVIETNQTNIKTNLVSQTAILTGIQVKLSDSIVWRSGIERQVALLEQDVERLKK
jgi:hypothetical protein